MYDIETKNLVKKYGELTAVNNVNLLVEEKSVFTLLPVGLSRQNNNRRVAYADGNFVDTE